MPNFPQNISLKSLVFWIKTSQDLSVVLTSQLIHFQELNYTIDFFCRICLSYCLSQWEVELWESSEVSDLQMLLLKCWATHNVTYLPIPSISLQHHACLGNRATECLDLRMVSAFSVVIMMLIKKTFPSEYPLNWVMTFMVFLFYSFC